MPPRSGTRPRTADDPAFANPTKPIGPLYTRAEADTISRERGWSMSPDGDKFRRVVTPDERRIATGDPGQLGAA